MLNENQIGVPIYALRFVIAHFKSYDSKSYLKKKKLHNIYNQLLLFRIDGTFELPGWEISHTLRHSLPQDLVFD